MCHGLMYANPSLYPSVEGNLQINSSLIISVISVIGVQSSISSNSVSGKWPGCTANEELLSFQAVQCFVFFLFLLEHL